MHRKRNNNRTGMSFGNFMEKLTDSFDEEIRRMEFDYEIKKNVQSDIEIPTNIQKNEMIIESEK